MKLEDKFANRTPSYKPIDAEDSRDMGFSRPAPNPNLSNNSSGIKVSGDKLNWPNDGAWYEVQSSSTHEKVAEGKNGATLPPGVYNVINHRTKEVHHGIQIVGNDNSPSWTSLAGSLTSTEVLAAGMNRSGQQSAQSDAARSEWTSSADEISQNRRAGNTAYTYSAGNSIVSSDSARSAYETSASDPVDTQTTISSTTYADSSPEEFRSDQRRNTGLGAVGGLIGGNLTVAAGGAALGYASSELLDADTVVVRTHTDTNGNTTRTVSGDTENGGNEPVRSSTTSITTYESGRQVTRTTDGSSGDTTTRDTDSFGVTTTTRSTADTDAASSPITNVTRDEDGVEIGRTVTSPTGGTYEASTPETTADNDSSSSDSGGGGRVICTHFYKQGMLDRETWRADLVFTANNLSETTVRGYQYWAIPYVKLMRRSPLAERIMFPLAYHRAKELAFQLGTSEQGSIPGKFIRLILEPVCFAIGLAVKQKDWTHLWVKRAPELIPSNSFSLQKP